MEDKLKILKVEYLSNHLLDHIRILNLSLDEQTIFDKSFKWRRPLVEDNLEIFLVKYLRNCLLENSQILTLRLNDLNIFC
jgi:hypothetical protein